MRSPKPRFRGRALIAGLMALMVGVAGCDDDDDIIDTGGLEEEDLIGTYEAITFTFQEEGGAVQSVLTAGGDMTVVLGAGGSLTGSILAPGFGAGGVDVDETFTGSWAFDDPSDEVDLTFDSELFPGGIDDLDVDESSTSSDLELSGSEDYGTFTTAVTLRQQ